eukprot:353262-Chlamydomonas_euryale.AAC.2
MRAGGRVSKGACGRHRRSGGDSIGALGPRWPAWQSMDVHNAGSHRRGSSTPCFGALANAALPRLAPATEIA